MVQGPLDGMTRGVGTLLWAAPEVNRREHKWYTPYVWVHNYYTL